MRVARARTRCSVCLSGVRIQPFAEVAAARKAGQESLSRLAVRLLTRWIDGSGGGGAEAEVAGFAFRTIQRYDVAIRRYRKRRGQRRRRKEETTTDVPPAASPHEPWSGAEREGRSA